MGSMAAAIKLILLQFMILQFYYARGGSFEVYQNQMNIYAVVETIEVNGEIVDCVDINKQPSLQHPLLQNHEIQTEPTSFPVDQKPSSSFSKSNQVKMQEAECPLGTVPIYRTPNDHPTFLPDMFFADLNNSKDVLPGKTRLAALRTKDEYNYIYRGVMGNPALYNLDVQKKQISISGVWIENFEDNPKNIIVTGHMVSPYLKGDNRPRMFVYWSGNGRGNGGCYDFRCPGYVQVHRKIAPGSAFVPVSTYGGQTTDQRYVIFEDQKTGNWWITIGEPSVTIGYFPKELFTHLNARSNRLGWGGVAVAAGDGTMPPMGSGHKPDGDFKRSGYVRGVQYVDANFIAQSPLRNGVTKFVDESGCYGFDNWGYNSNWGYVILYGGPGGFCGRG